MHRPIDGAAEDAYADHESGADLTSEDATAAGLSPAVGHLVRPSLIDRADIDLSAMHVAVVGVEVATPAHKSDRVAKRAGEVALDTEDAVGDAVPRTREASDLIADEDVEDGELTADPRYTYGHAAVALAELHARAVIEENAKVERLTKALLDIELVKLRNDFAEWEAGLEAPDTDEHFEATGIIEHFNELDRPHMPPSLVHVIIKDEHEPDQVVSGALKATEGEQTYGEKAPPLFTWLKYLSDERLINYLQWSEARTVAVTQALQRERDIIEQNVREDFSHIIEDGLAPIGTEEELERGFAHTVRFGAMSAIESGFYHAGGFYIDEVGRLGIRREFDAEHVGEYVRLRPDVFTHENLHALDFANDMGLIYLLSEDEEELTWVNEAVKEHLTLAGANGQSYTVDPNERSDAGAYPLLRQLLHLTMTAGTFDIELQQITLANFEQRGGDGLCRQELYERLRESYLDHLPDLPPGQTILHVIAEEHNAAPKPLKADVIKHWIGKLYEWKIPSTLLPEPTQSANFRKATFDPDQ
jgi:hypothetical protein